MTKIIFVLPLGLYQALNFSSLVKIRTMGLSPKPYIKKGMIKMLLKNNSEKVKILVRYFETLSIENKLKLFIIVLESDMIKLKIDKENLIELLKKFLCVFDKNYNKNRIVTLEYNMDVFILSKVMEMNEIEKENFVLELLYGTYKIIKK